MQADYYNAFQRHLTDAECLYNASRLANADQLYAYSAECGLKCLMKQFGMPVDPVTGAPINDKKDRVHINKTWYRFEAYRFGSGSAGYVLPQPNPFDDWEISNRYANESNFSLTYVAPHRQGVQTVESLLRKAILEGRLIV
jgi:hypothetical protein